MGVAWILIRLFSIVKAFILSHYEISAKDNLEARRVNDMLDVTQRIIGFPVILGAVSSILMIFDKVRQIGVSILMNGLPTLVSAGKTP